MQRDMRHVVSKIEKKRLSFRTLYKTDCLVCVTECERVLISRLLDYFGVAHNRCGVHVVAVRNPEIVIEAMIDRTMRTYAAQVPLTDTCRRIATILQGLRHCRFGLRKSGLIGGKQDIGQSHLIDAHAGSVASGHQCRT